MATTASITMHDDAGSARPDLKGLTLAFQEFLDAVPAGAIAVDAQGAIVATNAELVRQFGYRGDELLGRAVEILVPVNLRAAHVAMRSPISWSEPARTMGAGRSLQGQRKDGSVFPVEIGLRALHSGGERIVLAVITDRSDSVRAAALEAHEKALGLELAHQEVVAREMGHRVKNLMATMAALVSLSAREAHTPREMEDSLRGRILALSSVIDLSVKAPQSGASHGLLAIRDILAAVLAPFMQTQTESDRISLSGPRLAIGQRPSEVLALVFHELATNAIKYGALQQLQGKLVVDWREADARLELCWREELLRPLDTTAPQTKGFGMALMSRLIEIEFGGRLDREVAAGGWKTSLSIPASSLEH